MPDDPYLATIDPHSKPCSCLGAPINLVWATPGKSQILGYQCGRCGKRWPWDAAGRGIHA